jgi:hypothetical protein
MPSPELSLDEIFQHMTDFELCDGLTSAIEERYGYDLLMTWPSSVPLVQKVVHFVWSTTGFLECEGFARFFNLDCKHSAYPDCFDILGFSSFATNIRKTLALFPQCDLGNTDALIAHFGSWKRIEELVDATESELYSNSKAIEKALAKYARDHKSEFALLLPEIRKQRAYEKLIKRLKHGQK